MKVLFAALLLTGFSGLFSGLAHAKECVPQAEMAEIAKHFTQFSDLAKGEYCFDGSQTSHLIAGIAFMRKTRYSPMERSKDELFSGKFADNWYDYFIGRISDFQIDESCPKGVIAYVYIFGGQTMYVCSAALTDNFTALDRASVFMHEARHIDGFPHATCSHGPRRGLRGACDNRISEGGSYAVTVETYAQLSRFAEGIHPAMRAYARSSAVLYADEAFESPVRINRSSQFLVMTKDKRFHTVKADGAVKALGSSPFLGRVVMRGQHMVLFPEDRNQTSRFVFARGEGELPQTAGDIAGEYNAQTPAERANLVDVHIGAQWNARVYKDKVRLACSTSNNSSTDLPLAEAPVGLIFPGGYDRAAVTTQLMMESGQVLDVSCAGGQASVRPSSVALDRKYSAVHKLGNLVLGVTTDGFLREIQGNTSRAFSLGKLDGQVHTLVPNQAVEFFGEN